MQDSGSILPLHYGTFQPRSATEQVFGADVPRDLGESVAGIVVARGALVHDEERVECVELLFEFADALECFLVGAHDTRSVA